MKAVLMSIRPKWCELIASGKKTIEVRKTRPKLETPFKVYIYQTKCKWFYDLLIKMDRLKTAQVLADGLCKVIGEFVCDGTIPISVKYSNPEHHLAHREFPYTCLTDKQIMDYLGNGNTGYGWHISDLVIYDEPKELGEFIRVCSEWEKEENTPKCKKCDHYFMSWAECYAGCDCDGELPITRPPQSWCYVEELP